MGLRLYSAKLGLGLGLSLAICGFTRLDCKIFEAHSDFSLLRNLLLCQYTQNLVDKTAHTHYENYRCEKLDRLIPGEFGEDFSEKNLLTFFEHESERYLHQIEKMKDQMEIIYNQKLESRKKNIFLFDQVQTEEIEGERRSIDIERENIETRRNKFEKEKAEWNASQLSFKKRNSKSMESLRKKNKLKFHLGAINLGNQ